MQTQAISPAGFRNQFAPWIQNGFPQPSANDPVVNAKYKASYPSTFKRRPASSFIKVSAQEMN